MADRRVIFNGDAGTTWVNDTDRVRYQFVASLINTCGACLQYHLAIGGWWPIPLHHRCRCRQYPVAPGAPAPNPFVDFRELLDGLPHPQQVAAIGASNYRLLRAGVVKWEEIVTKYRVRTLREVLAINKVSLKTALEAGVKPGWIKAAEAAVHTPEAELFRQHRAELIENLKARGVSQEQLVHEISRGLVGQVTVAGVAVPEQSMAALAANIPHAAGLAELLKTWRPKPRRPKEPPPEPPAGTAPVPGPKAPAGPVPAAPAAPPPATMPLPPEPIPPPSDAEINKALDSLYSKAEAAKQQIDSVASEIAREVRQGATVKKAPLKGRERAFEKVKKEYRGVVSRLTDLARNTIVVDEPVFDKVVVLLDKEGATIKVIGPGVDPMGYTGINAKLPTKAGLTGEIQVNSPKMIYAKESPANAKSILGEEKWNEIAAKTNLPGGLGHKLYEEYRSLPLGDPERDRLEIESSAYYNQIRERG